MLTKEEFKDICEDNELLNEIDNIRTVLNDIGTIIGFNDDNDHIINPPEMIDKIYEIIRSKDMNDEGKLDKRKDKDSYYNWIIEFLLKNKIVLEIEKSKILIPSRLSVKKPENFLKENYMRKDIDNGVNYGLNFRYQYKRFNKSFFFEFFIKMKEYIDDENTKYWANGISWNFSKYKAVVLASKVHRTIDIHLSNNSLESRKFLTIIRKKLDEINKGHRGILKKIAVVDENNEVFYKSYSFLKRMQETENREVVLNIKGNPKSFKLSDLLDRYEYVEDEIVADEVKPLIITEGKTDKRILEIAWRKLYNKNMPFEIQSSGVEIEEDKNQGSADLVKRALELDKHKDRIIIGIFDNDAEGNNQFKGLKKNVFENYSIHKSIRKHLKKNIYGILLPVPEIRKKFVTEDDIGQRFFVIEHYFSNNILDRNNMKGKSILGTEVFKVNNGKDKFSKSIEELEKDEFESFQLLFNLIIQIIDTENLKLNKKKTSVSTNIQELIDSYDEIAILISDMRIGKIENFEKVKIELAQELKKIMQQSANTWSKAKKKALDRKVYIEGLLQ